MIVILCNCPPDVAPTIARRVVEEGLAACVNILPGVQSVYRWEGAVCEAAESTLILKTGLAQADALRARVVALHPYDVPEFIALPVDAARSLPAYLDWVREP